MKRYIRANSDETDYGGKLRYWDDPEIATRSTDQELDDSEKDRILDSVLDYMSYEYKYGKLRGQSTYDLWDYFVAHVTTLLEDTLTYDYPDASWASWYEDARSRFDAWSST